MNDKPIVYNGLFFVLAGFLASMGGFAFGQSVQPKAKSPSDAAIATKSEHNWQRYRSIFADRTLELASGMIDSDQTEVLLVSEDGKGRVVRLGGDGKPRWTTVMQDSVRSVRPPDYVIHQGRTIIVRGSGLAALDDKNGKILWTSDGPNDRLAAAAGLVLAGDCSVEPKGGRWMVARDVGTGTVAWKVRLPDKMEPRDITSVGDLLLVRGEEEITAGFSYFVTQTGQVLLKLDEAVTDALNVQGDLLLASNTRVARMDRKGKVKWQHPFEYRGTWPFTTRQFTSLPGGDFVMIKFGPISDSGVSVWRLDPSTGKIRWRAKCECLGVSHSAYQQCVYVRLMGEKLVVVSQGAAYFVAVLSLADGRKLERLEFERHYEYERQHRAAPGRPGG